MEINEERTYRHNGVVSSHKEQTISFAEKWIKTRDHCVRQNKPTQANSAFCIMWIHTYMVHVQIRDRKAGE